MNLLVYISFCISGKSVFRELFFFFNDIFFRVDRPYLNYGIFSNELGIFYIVLKDLNVFSEQKTNLGLFYLNNNLTLHLFYDKLMLLV